MQFLLVKVSCNAKNYTDQDDVNCEVPSRSKLCKTRQVFQRSKEFVPGLKLKLLLMRQFRLGFNNTSLSPG
jgi:hypothetical protein